MRRLALPALALVLAGCGNPTLKPYGDVQATKKCLAGAGYRIQTQFHDLIASTASRGALLARRRFNTLKVLYGDDAREARALKNAYRQAIRPRRRGRQIDAITNLERNALLLWTTTPSAGQLGRVVGCLK